MDPRVPAATPWRVLLVEDSRDDAELIEISLREAGLEVECLQAWSITAVQEALREFAPQLVLSDLNLPGFSAEEALALGRYDGTATLRNNLAAMLMDLGRTGEATAHFEAIVAEEQDPTLVTLAWARLVRLYSQQDRAADTNGSFQLSHRARLYPATVKIR